MAKRVTRQMGGSASEMKTFNVVFVKARSGEPFLCPWISSKAVRKDERGLLRNVALGITNFELGGAWNGEFKNATVGR